MIASVRLLIFLILYQYFISSLHDFGVTVLRTEDKHYGASYFYTPLVTERELIEQALYHMLDCVVKEYPSLLTHYLDSRREFAAA